jgi:predicted dehydrogenase
MICIAVVGAGHWGPNLIRNFHSGITSRVKYVVDSRPQRLQALEGRYPDVTMSTDYAQVLADPEVQAVVIATPTSTHHALCKQALEAGKHVLVEKPIAANLKDAEELDALSTRLGLVMMVGHVFLFNPAVRVVKKNIDDGELGRLFYISMERTNLGPIRLDVNAAWDLAAHDISIVDYWLGSAALTVSAVGAAYINPGVHDIVFATLKYPNDVLVNLKTSWLNPRKGRDITVVGDRRMLTFDDLNLQEPIRVYDKGVTDEKVGGVVDTFASFRASVREGELTLPAVPKGEPLKSECEHFLQCVETKAHPLSDAALGTRVVRALEAITRSLAAGGREEKV